MRASSRTAEADVEHQRIALERTLENLMDNLQPSHLAQEALSGGRWFDRFENFARTSYVSWAVMTIAAVGIGVQASRRTRR